MKIIILIQIIKCMPPYWDNKATLTPTLTLPDTLFSTFLLFPSFLLQINAFLILNLKREKKSLSKGGVEPGSIASKRI